MKLKTTTYQIKKGNHRISHSLYHYIKNFPVKKNTTFTKTFNITLTKSCLYDASLLGNDALDINKLWGYSLGKDHHENSIRFGWRCVENIAFVPSIYLYRNGERKFFELDRFFITPNEAIEFKIERESHRFGLYVEGIHISDVFFKTRIGKEKSYMLFPYFGGNQPAQKDLIIKFEAK